MVTFFHTISPNPKYPVYLQSCPNPDNDGYVEICKLPDPNNPPVGGPDFYFTATFPFFSTGSLEVPLNECSGAVPVPSGHLQITETPTIGDLVSNVTAYSYNLGGFYVNELDAWTFPDLNATVTVVPGDIALETIATFTNYAAPPGQLKICKIAGSTQVEGKTFTFTVTGGGTQNQYMIEAGPPDQGGFCELANAFPVNTPVTIAETPYPPYIPTSITVNQGQLSQCQPPSIYCRVATIGAGVTEVDFTNNVGGGLGCVGACGVH